MEDNKKELEAEVAKQLSEATGTQVDIKQMEAMLESKFTFLFKQLYKESSEMSSRQLARAVFNALDVGVDSGLAPRLISKEEASWGVYFAQLLDLRNVKIATKLHNKELEQKETQNVATEQTEVG